MQVKSLLLCGALLPAAVAAAPVSLASPGWPGAELRQPTADITVTGKVLDEKQAGLPGATVVLKGTSLGANTDADGNFSLRVPDGTASPTLVISSIGYVRQEIALNGRTNLTVSLVANTQDLNEVVVVGYGTQKRSDITGSVASVRQDRLEKIPVANVAQALEGAVAGVNISTTSSLPGTQPAINIRGVRSITANTSPYLIVDGLPFPGTLNDINSNDIASIEVLKDASSTAIYGTRGSNGVILITTKRGKTGKPEIRYNGYAGPEYLVYKLHPLDGPAYAQKYQDYATQRGLTLTQALPNYTEVTNLQAGKTVDWMQEIRQQGLVQDHNLSISGGTDNVRYFVGGELFKQRGVIKGFQFQRINVRANVDANITPWLRIGTSSFFSSNNDGGGRANLSLAQVTSPYGNEYNADGTVTVYPELPELLIKNPLASLTTNRESVINQLTGTGYAEVDLPLKGLRYRLNGTYSYRPYRYAYYEGRQFGNNYGAAQLLNEERHNYTVENILSYNRDFGKHHVDVTALYSAQQNTYFTTTENGSGYINDQTGYNGIGGGSLSPTLSSYSERRALLSQMARINYNYDSRYLLTATARRDGSTVFGANTSKYGVFPSVAVGWNVANEAFLKDNRVLNVLKLRFSVGTTGNEGINPYQTITGLTQLQYAYNGVTATGLRANVLGNANLKWERTTSTNYAVDFGLLGNRITGTVEYYDAKTSDLLLNRALPIITGYGSILDNVGAVRNQGVDVTLTTANIQTSAFTWETNFNFSAVRNRVTQVYGTGGDDIGNNLFIGKPLFGIYSYVKTGVWQQGEDVSKQDPSAKPGDLKFADLNGDGVINALDRQYLGSSIPDWQGGITNTFTYKGLSLRVFFQTAQGILKSNGNLSFADLGGRVNTPQEIGYWTPQNGSQDRPGLNYTNPRGYSYPSSASYTRLKDVTLSYNFPAAITEKLHLGSLSVYLSGRNLYTWTPWIGWDPEQNYTLGNGTGNVDNPTSSNVINATSTTYLNYPNTRTFVAGLNVSLR
ncbi:TonB-dependent receptor [Hymenobacter sp. UV11]|uniref:SusC/RagA family TonB-linked outer membrane protein n=1 Tax=Hymenobacter sp. UV11 TaxID=1849735 RepID=UPI00105D0BC9|nr:TonB-dependent receptor [Hymenobacter sp. UV11]TDN37562.1 SusC/RagA family TonB-linked outer membrane protein [Hymenobacter sp. UV11]TFZ68758.1 TonB-dependent receptor [Hymenobacter sp. UV11]